MWAALENLLGKKPRAAKHGGDRIGAAGTAVIFRRERCGGDHEVSILMMTDGWKAMAPMAAG